MSELIQTTIEHWGVVGVIFIAMGWVLYDLYKTFKLNMMRRKSDQPDTKDSINIYTSPSPDKKENLIDQKIDQLSDSVRMMSDSLKKLKELESGAPSSMNLRRARSTIKNILKAHLGLTGIDHAILAIIRDDSVLEVVGEAYNTNHIDALRSADINNINIKRHSEVFEQLLYCGHSEYWLESDSQNSQNLAIDDVVLYGMVKKWGIQTVWLDVIPINHDDNILHLAILFGYSFGPPAGYDKNAANITIRTIESLMSEI